MSRGLRARELKLNEDYTGIQGGSSKFVARRISSIHIIQKYTGTLKLGH